MLIVGLIVSSALLVCDAWFDVVTSIGTDDQMLTLLTALAIELPLAFYFALLTRRVLVTAIRVSRPEYAGTRPALRAARHGAPRGAEPVTPLRLRATAAKAAIGAVDVLVGERGGELGADARLAQRHDRVGERDGVDAVLEQRLGGGARAVRVAEHHRHDGVLARHDVEAERRELAPEARACARTAARAARRPRSPAGRARRGSRPRSAGRGCWRRDTGASAGAAARSPRAARSCSRRSRRRAPCRACP